MVSVLPVAHRGKLPVVAELAVDVVILPWGESNTSQLSIPSGRAALFTLFAQLFLYSYRLSEGWFWGGVVRVIGPTVVDCVVCQLGLAEYAGGTPGNQNSFFYFFFLTSCGSSHSLP